MYYKISNNGINLIKKYEGCRLTAYLCPAGVWTIGWGHTGNVHKGDKITQAEADALLIRDLAPAESAVNRYQLSWMNQNRFDALVSFTYNCGSGNLAKLLDNGKRLPGTVYAKIALYNKAAGKELSGLTKRRNEERALFAKPCVSECYPKYTGGSTRIDVVLNAIGVPSKYVGSVTKRKPLMLANGFTSYSGKASENLAAIKICREGKLKRVN